ncbi:lipocalin-like domain-containing protein [Litorilituus sediminis]|uniref:ABC transporter n=1 Tax=Litorilituus sediminis TaxID=718192 RepID=A0A4P6PB17_9GAMM|nr:lipocalin-like domain-containing protein [Litorilituus sediminis]QBG36872.1 ABC transporter [Litorilituus sediminis]
MLKASLLKLWFLLITILMLVACQPAQQESAPTAFQMASGAAVKPGAKLVFPQDHGIHQAQGIEWWYITANLQSDTGETFGVQWTLFRTLMPSTLASTWWDNNIYFAHFAIQHQQTHVAFERGLARANQAKVVTAPFTAAIDDWQLKSQGQAFLPLNLSAVEDNFAVNLTLGDSPMTLHGDNGYSQKTESGHASYYFSYPFLKVEGAITFAGKEYQVTGNAWYDREWSASLLDKSQLGWDWFSLVDEASGEQGLMLFCIRGSDQGYDYCSATEIAPDGKASAIAREDITLAVLETVSLEGQKYPSKWRASLPNRDDIILETITKDSRNQLTIPYWEGRVKASGGFNGLGYAELVGY